jgi:hypothetical protein
MLLPGPLLKRFVRELMMGKSKQGTPQSRPSPANGKFWTFREVFSAEYHDLYARCPSIKPESPEGQKPTVENGLVGIALSGGGIRSSTFCLGALQAMNAAGILANANYLSTVSGGGYIGTATTIAMSESPHAFPFSKTGLDVGETFETRHLRDNSRYLLQNGLSSAISAVAIYLRGIIMNIMVVLPILLIAAAALVFLKPNVSQLSSAWAWMDGLPDTIKNAPMPLSMLALFVVVALLAIYAIGVSIVPIISLKRRRHLARFAAIVMALFALVVLLELHFVLLQLAFATHDSPAKALIDKGNQAVRWATPLVVAILPFLKSIAEKAVSENVNSMSDRLKKWLSRLALIVAAAIVPALLWLTVLQLAHWGIAVCDPASPAAAAHDRSCWTNAPKILQDLFASASIPIDERAAAIYACFAGLFLVVWPVLNVNANSLHQLYRDRLGSAFLVRRTSSGPKLFAAADNFALSDIKTDYAPYHLLNAALNVPGSSYANRRGRNADFFIFSKNFVGSEATGYVRTDLAEEVNDGLNIGTAMAISGAAAAPNMGVASLRPLSATIALFNIRLGRWLRHPLITLKEAGRSGIVTWWKGKPGPFYLLREAFFKSGTNVVDPETEEPVSSGFVFLTDGGHIENLGIYELLKRRCALILAIDGEADPEMTSSSLVQLERFARIDLGTQLVLNWEPIGSRSRAARRKLSIARSMRNMGRM